MFNLDSAQIQIQTDIKDRWRSIKIAIGSAVGCITALVTFILVILYLRRRCSRSEQEAKHEDVPLR